MNVTQQDEVNNCCNVGVIFVTDYSSCHACCTRNVATDVKVSWRSTVFNAYVETHLKDERLIPVLVAALVEILKLRE